MNLTNSQKEEKRRATRFFRKLNKVQLRLRELFGKLARRTLAVKRISICPHTYERKEEVLEVFKNRTDIVNRLQQELVARGGTW